MSDQLPIDYEARANGRSPLREYHGDLTDLETRILAAIQRGRANAVGVKLLADLTGVHWRQAQLTVQHLILDHGACIGTNTRPPYGYYIMTEPEEIEDVYRSLRSRGLATLHRAANLKKISVEEVFHQGRLDQEVSRG